MLLLVQRKHPVTEDSSSTARERGRVSHSHDVVALLAYFERHALLDQARPAGEHDLQRFAHQISETVFTVNVVVTDERIPAPINKQSVLQYVTCPRFLSHRRSSANSCIPQVAAATVAQ